MPYPKAVQKRRSHWVQLRPVTMTTSGKAPAAEQLHRSDNSDIDEDLWALPPKSKPKPKPVGRAPQPNPQPRTAEPMQERQTAHEEALRRELQSVRKVNEAIEGAIESLAKAKNSMKVCAEAQPIPPPQSSPVGQENSQNDLPSTAALTPQRPDRPHHRLRGLLPAVDMDQDPLADRAQPATAPQPVLARRQPRSRRRRARVPRPAAGGGAERVRRTGTSGDGRGAQGGR